MVKKPSERIIELAKIEKLKFIDGLKEEGIEEYQLEKEVKYSDFLTDGIIRFLDEVFTGDSRGWKVWEKRKEDGEDL